MNFRFAASTAHEFRIDPAPAGVHGDRQPGCTAGDAAAEEASRMEDLPLTEGLLCRLREAGL
jgi:hypothetical protein